MPVVLFRQIFLNRWRVEAPEAGEAPGGTARSGVLYIVFQIVLSGVLPARPALRSRCMADPDALLSIQNQEGPWCYSKEGCDQFSLILHDLRMGGAWKRTNRGRLKRTEEMLCTHLRPKLPGTLTLLDIGASDGITTLEAVCALRRAFGVEVHALLADSNICLLRYRRGPIVEYRAADGEPIMVRCGRIGIRLARQRGEADASDNLLARAYLQLGRFRRSMQLDARISLVNPAVRRDPGITIMELDCLAFEETLKGTASAVRASNILNLGYFGLPQLRRAVSHIHAYLRDGGCLVISRNDGRPDDEFENGSVWLKEADRFRWLEDFGSGSEIKSVVNDWSPG